MLGKQHDIPPDKRVEFIPVEWRSSLKLDEGLVHIYFLTLKWPSHDKQLATNSILANFFTNFFVLVNSYLTIG